MFSSLRQQFPLYSNSRSTGMWAWLPLLWLLCVRMDLLGVLTAPFFNPTSRPSLPGGPPITLMYRIRDSITHSFSLTLLKDRHWSLFSCRRAEREGWGFNYIWQMERWLVQHCQTFLFSSFHSVLISSFKQFKHTRKCLANPKHSALLSIKRCLKKAMP